MPGGFHWWSRSPRRTYRKSQGQQLIESCHWCHGCHGCHGYPTELCRSWPASPVTGWHFADLIFGEQFGDPCIVWHWGLSQKVHMVHPPTSLHGCATGHPLLDRPRGDVLLPVGQQTPGCCQAESLLAGLPGWGAKNGGGNLCHGGYPMSPWLSILQWSNESNDLDDLGVLLFQETSKYRSGLPSRIACEWLFIGKSIKALVCLKIGYTPNIVILIGQISFNDDQWSTIKFWCILCSKTPILTFSTSSFNSSYLEQIQKMT